MLCKAENRDPGHCLKEGRRVTRCAQDLYVWLGYPCYKPLNEAVRITKMRENCLKQFDEHWNCLEANNQVILMPLHSLDGSQNIRRNTIGVESQNEHLTSACLRNSYVSAHTLSHATDVRPCTGLDQNHPGFTVWPETDSRSREPGFHWSAEVDNYIHRHSHLIPSTSITSGIRDFSRRL